MEKNYGSRKSPPGDFFYDYYIITVGFYELHYLCRAMNKLEHRAGPTNKIKK